MGRPVICFVKAKLHPVDLMFLYIIKCFPIGSFQPASYPPMYGFSGERKERKMIATEDEMIKAMVPLKYRDYCAHHYINYQKCARTRPMIDFFNQCGGEKHEWEHCQYEDFIMR